jgi:hypothetical protein
VRARSVRYPGSKQEERGDRSRWPWLPATIVEQCGIAAANVVCGVTGFTAVVSYTHIYDLGRALAGRAARCACYGGSSYVQGLKPGWYGSAG